MINVKPWWQSRAVWGAILTIVSSIGLAGISYDADSNTLVIQLDTLTTWVLAAGGPIGGLLALMGRVRAGARITW